MAVALVTRMDDGTLRRALEAEGLKVKVVPLLRFEATGAEPPATPPDVVVVTSARAAPHAAPRLRGLGGSVVAVGDATARALRMAGVAVDDVVGGDGAAAVAAAAARGRRILFVGAQEPADTTTEALAALEGRVDHWAVYRSVVDDDVAERLRDVLPVDVVTLTSPLAARAFATHTPWRGAPIAVIGPSTARACAALGLRVDAVAEAADMAALAAAAAQCVRG